MISAYFKRSKRITKSILAFATTPSFANARLRFLDFFCQNVTFERLLVSDLSCARYFETLFGTGVCFNLWHFYMLVILHP